MAHAREEVALGAARRLRGQACGAVGRGLVQRRLVEHEGHGLPAARLDARNADQHRHAAAILANVLLRVGRAGAALARLGHCLLGDLAIFGRRHLVAVDAAGAQIVAVVADDAQVGVVGLDRLAIEVEEHDAGEVGVHHLAQPRLARAQGGVAALERGHALLQRAHKLAHALRHLCERVREHADLILAGGHGQRRVEFAVADRIGRTR